VSGAGTKRDALAERGEAGLLGQPAMEPSSSPSGVWSMFSRGSEGARDSEPSDEQAEDAGLLGSVGRYISGAGPRAPPEPPEWTCGMSSGQRFQVALVLGLASFLLYMMSFFVFLPMLIFVPGKFALSFTLASVFLIAAISVIRGPRKTLTGLVSREKIVFTIGYIASLGKSRGVLSSRCSTW
jgi:hypothetical protein